MTDSSPDSHRYQTVRFARSSQSSIGCKPTRQPSFNPARNECQRVAYASPMGARECHPRSLQRLPQSRENGSLSGPKCGGKFDSFRVDTPQMHLCAAGPKESKAGPGWGAISSPIGGPPSPFQFDESMTGATAPAARIDWIGLMQRWFGSHEARLPPVPSPRRAEHPSPSRSP